MKFRLLPLALIATTAYAQPTTDIGLFAGTAANTLEVRVRPNASFTEVMSSLTFTIRWESTSGATIAGPSTLSIGQNCPGGFFVTPSGDSTVTNGGFNYYTFNAFGFAQLSAACPGQTWTANTERVIATIPIRPGVACANFRIVNDAYTTANNKDFFISLNGLPRTGTIYSAAAVKAVRGDLNRDGQVNITDFGLFVNAFGAPCTGCAADLNFDNTVNVSDFGLFVNVFGIVCP
ncbi:MAG TPA: dockerin type I domain-containing protein [Flavobacteriales bacterium]|nr:dockerin type I domain-containing protein [Flavobacteriales bacterium]HMR26233.1 dockerin type I domain-containing protein [Flavobacteriales bacterium]